MENANNSSEKSVNPEKGTEQAVSEDVAEGEGKPVMTVDPNGGTELEVTEDNVEDWETEDETDDEDGEEDDDDNDDDEEGDSSEEDSGEETEDYEFEEDEEEGETETCPICLDRLKDQDVGTPESCDHVFCLECIQEWAKNVNTCPVDRQVFHLIFARHAGKDAIFKKITVEDKEQDDPEVEEDPIFCEACGRSDREDRLLLCDGCDLGYHCECLSPPLAEVPAEEWYCPDCEALQDREREGEVAVTVSDDEEIYHIIQEAGVLPHSLRPRRQVARTRMSERIYRQIQEIRRSRFNRRMIILSDSESSEESGLDFSGEDFNVDDDAPSTSTASAATRKKTSTRRKKKTTGRKTKVKRKSPKKRKGSTGKSKKGKQLAKKKNKGKKTKRKTRKTKKSTSKRKGLWRKRVVRRRSIPDTPVTSVKSRIAKSLGLSKPPTGRSIPLQKRPRDRAEDFGPAPLSIMGTPNDLFYFQDEAENQPSTSGHSSQSGKKPKMSSNLQFSAEEIMKRTPVVRIAVDSSLRFWPQEEIATLTSASGSTPCDLLGSIFQGQQMLHMNTNKIKIHRDGSLTAVKADADPKTGESKSPDSKDGKAQPGELTQAEGGTPSKEKEQAGSEVGTGSKFLRLPIFAGSSSVELDDKVELPEDPPEVPFQEDDGLGDSLWTIQKRKGEIEFEHLENSSLEGGKAVSQEQRKNEESDLVKRDDRTVKKSFSRDNDIENKSNEEKVKLDQTSKSDKHRTPGKGKESKNRNYRSNQALFTTHKSKKTDLYSDIDDSLDVPTTSAVFVKKSQGVGEKSKKHSEKSVPNKVKVGDKSICSDMFDDRTQDSISDLGKLEDLDDFKLEKSPKAGDLPTLSNPLLDDVKFEYEDSNDSVPSTSWSDAGIGSAIITQEQYSDKKWRMDKVQSMDQELNSKSSSHKSPKGSHRRSNSKGKEQDPGLLITVAGGSEDRSVAERTEKNREIYEQQKIRKNESEHQSSEDRREKSSSKSRSYYREDNSDHYKSRSRRHRSRSGSRERRRRSRSRSGERSRDSRDRRERTRSRDRRERTRSRERQDGSRHREKIFKSKDKRERSRSIEHKTRERRERSRSWERREGSKSTEKRQRSRSRDRRKSKRGRSRSVERRKERSRSLERRRERSRSLERRRDRSRSVERKPDQHKQEQTRSTERHRDRSRSIERRQSTDEGHSRSMEHSSKKSRREKSSEKRKSRDFISSPPRQEIEERLEQEEKLDVFSCGIKRLHDGKSKKKKKLKTTEIEPIVILSDDEHDQTPKMKLDRSSMKNKTNSNERDSNRIEPIITARSSTDHHTIATSEVHEPPLPTEEVIQPPMPTAISNVVKVLTDSREHKRSKSRHKEVEEEIFPREEAKIKDSDNHGSFEDDMEDRSFEEECAYDPAFPTVDMEESPTEDQPIVLEEAAEPIQMTVNPLLHKELPMQSISPLPGPPPPPMPSQGLLGEPSILLPAPAGEPPQSMLTGAGQQIPLQLRMLAPGFAAQQPGGLPPQRQLIMNHPVFINRPGSFPHLQQLPAGHPLQPRLVSTPGGMVTMQNQFSPRIPSLVSVPGQHGLLNGALDHLSHDPHLILTSDPHGDPRLHHPHPPHPEPRVISIRPEVPVVPMSAHENMPLSIASSEALSINQPNIIPSVSQLEQISQITKLLNTQAQLAMFGKESKGMEHHEHKQEPMEQKNSNNVFKVPLPPILTHTLSKVKSEKENMEMVDMDMSSPQDNGNIEIPTSSSEKSERSRRRDKKRSHRHKDKHRTSHEDRHRGSHEDSVSSTVESQKTFDQIMDEMNSVDEIPSSAVELTNKEKYLRKLHLQERVVDEVKTALKPFYSAKKVNKEQYKEILRRAVPKVCHSKSGDINPVKIRALVDAYVAKFNRNMSPPKDDNEDQPKKAQ